MKRKFFGILLFVLVLSFFGCKNDFETGAGKGIEKSNQFIESVSPAGIDRLGKIAVSFLYEPKCPMGEAISISPNQKGTWDFEGKTAIFTPEKPYKANSKIVLTADCKKLFGADESEGIFKRVFHVSPPNYDISFNEVRFDEKNQTYQVSGKVKTDIPVTETELQKSLKAKLNGKKANGKQNVVWQQAESGTNWNFFIDDIPSSENNVSLCLDWAVKALGMTRNQVKYSAVKKIIQIPAKTAFTLLDVNTSKPNTIQLSFSKMLDKSQNPASFLRIFDSEGKVVSDVDTSVRGNVLSIFSDSDFSNVQTISMESGLKSSDGIYLAKMPDVVVSDKWDLPAIRFPNENVILPTTQGAVFPIETRNLTGVLVQVYAIYERNITQFLQDSELTDVSRLYRVGEPVWEKKISFKWHNTYQNKYITNGLDLSSLVKKYPNGMFHIRVTFRPDQIKYKCNSKHGDFSELPAPPDTIKAYSVPNEKSSWDYWENVNKKDRNSYWSNRNDPCHPAFYMPDYNSECIRSRNILISDLGIMAKRDNAGKLFVTVTDLRTAQPIENVPVELRNYVGSVIATLNTDSDGSAVFNDSEKAFFVAASKNEQTSYLKLTASTNLSTSHFEIGGENSKKGLKGFIYGERGVWRPGDDLYLTFVLQDLKKTLPENIPVKFELIDPLGRVTDTQILTENVNNFYPIKTKTDSTATTGLWTGRVTIGGKTWTKGLSIEAVVPNHLSVELETDKEYLETFNNNFIIKGAWLHGAPTPKYKADVSVAYSKAETVFDGYADYTFTNLNNNIENSRETIWSGTLNEDSSVSFVTSMDTGRNLPGKLKANFVTRIFEPSGAFSTQAKSIIYSPYSRYVGIKLPKGDAARNMLLTDTEHTVDVVLLDVDGNPENIAKLNYTVYKIEWKWWWEKDAYTSATHVSSSYYSKVASGNLDIKDGKGSFKFQVKYPDWGRYLVEVSDGSYGHSAGKIVYIDWPGWAGRAQEGGTGSSAMVPLVTSKKQYSTGEVAEISFTSNSNAYAYVTLEKGGEIFKQQKIETVEGTNVYKIPLTSDMAPNIYVHVSLLQPHMQTANSLPIRLYGVVPVLVDNPDTKLNPEIEMPESYEPNKNAKLSISERDGKGMTFTVAVVDEGLLGLTNFHGANLRNEFYKKEASELENWDIFKYVMNAYSGKLETLLAIGGSEEIDNNNANNENRFDPVVKYFGPFYIGANGKKDIEFEMPNYIGAVRAIVIAGDNGAYGVSEKSVPVKSPLMVQTSIPRTLGTNEKITIPVNLFNGDDFDKTADVTMKISGSIDFNESQTIKIPANSNVTANFVVQTNLSGMAAFETTVSTDKESAYSTDKVLVESRGIPVTNKQAFVIKPRKNLKVTVPTPGEKGSEDLRVELSLLPQIDLSERLAYLTQYPHGCIEQITSGGFPQLFVPSYMELTANEKNRIADNIQSVFDRYPTYQTPSGAMGYWPGNQEPHAWGTCYSSHFMLEAKEKGYAIPQDILSAELKWLSDTASEWTSSSRDSANIQAYRLFVLSLAGKPNISAMNRLEQVYSLDKEGILLLAGAYSNIGRKEKALNLLRGYPLSTSRYRNTGGDFGSDVRETAMYLYTCIQADYLDQVPPIAEKLAEILSSTRGLNTQECAWALYAMLPYYTNQTHAENSYKISCNGVSKEGTITLSNIIEPLTANSDTPDQLLAIENTGKAVLYGTLICSGKSVPGTEQEQEEGGLRLTVSGLEKDEYKIGENVTFKVTVSNYSGKNVENLALTIPLPTCFEFSNERISDQNYTNSAYNYQDIRDDYIYTYFDLSNRQNVQYTFNATVAYKGDFCIPAIHVEAMYDDDIRAVKPGKLIQMQ